MVNNGRITSPGNSPGVLPIVGNYTENGTLVIEIGGLGGAGVNPTGYDQVAVGGTTTLNPAGSVLQIVKFTAFEPAKGDTFQIINGTPGSIHGHFGALTTSFINDLVFILGTGELIGTGQAAGSPILGAFPGATDNQKRILASLQVVDHQFAGGDLLPLLLNAAINGSAKVSDRFSLTARLGVAHDFEQSSRDVLANVVGEPTVFSVRAPGMGQTEIKLGLGVNIIVAPRFTLRLSYQAGFAGDAQNDNAFFIGGSFGF